MDQNFISNVFVAKDIARTSTPQITDPTTTATYIQVGEIFTVQESTVYVAGTGAPTKTKPIRLVMKSSDGLRIVQSPDIYGGNVKRWGLLAYSAPYHQVGALTIDDDVIPNYDYIIRVVRTKTAEMHDFLPSYILARYTTTSSTTKAQLIAGLYASLNIQVANDPSWDTITFSAGGTNSEVLIATAVAPSYYEAGKFDYQQLRFEMQAVNVNFTYADNLGAAISLGGYTYSNVCTYGNGSYEEVKSMEWFAANNQFGGLAGGQFNRPYETKNIGLNAESGKTYDKIVIELEPEGGQISNNWKTPNTIILCLPVSVVGSEQTADIVNVLNDYLYTGWGLGQITATGGHT